MRIHETLKARPSELKRAQTGKGSGASGFAGLLNAGSAEAAAPATHAAPVAALGGLLSLQMVDDAAERRAKAVAHGRDLLDHLESLQRLLLLGGVPLGRLQSIAASLNNYPSDSDPVLQDILADIQLRVAVELAKFGIVAHEPSGA